MNRSPCLLLGLAALSFSACSSPPTMHMNRNWSLNEIEAVIYSHPEIKSIPRKYPLREFTIKDRDTLVVAIGDYGFLSGGGIFITLKLNKRGSWDVLEVTPFDS